ncbi:diguanylate cyclase [Nodosilinea sp. LEGE 07088]|uniref:sensor domain-containing diguanylate cyclase n=1 Tax=Nodosilinea sp. LEGE 07088 TaxID=2777968 RepID=UPI001880EA10|nr:GGDEF domain-containing protein [Nodosilinea sp. LEGE 07088]MBE9136882.1 diguanylate cyclase [Nodosilinea sp. LEGE 07088]
MDSSSVDFLQTPILDILPNPVLVKDAELRYVLVNQAFESLFGVSQADLAGKLDKDVFKERQAVQCNAGDLRVLASGEIDEAVETVFRADSTPREMITRKSRLTLPGGQVFLVGIMHDITEVSLINRKLQENQKLLQQQSAELNRMVYTDSLTSCGNRRFLFTHAPDIYAKHGNIGSLFMLDIDYFKGINDDFGHDAGDDVLIHFVKTVAQVIRAEDELVRIGGEEFVVMLPGVGGEAARLMAERIRQQVESSPLSYGSSSLAITVSIGVVDVVGSVDVGSLLIAGDRCLYQAKKAGRNCIVTAKRAVGRVN